MNYEEMSDLQINLLVSNAIGVDAPENSGVVFGAVKHDGDNVVSVIGVVDYCNNASDAWPIIYGNHISIINDYGWGAYHRRTGIESSMHVNPLRAAMIVFLMMQEQAK